MPTRFRLTLGMLPLLGGLIVAPGCSSQAVDPQEAEVVPDPAVKPVPPPAAASTTEPSSAPPAAPKP